MKKRFLSLLLALSLTAVLAAPVLAADTAATIRLSKTTGTVSVSKSSGKSLTLLSNMRLYNGYHVATSAKSYAWMNLDDAKLVKEDASSEVEVRKNGKKLEVNLISGKIFFDVTEKLDDDESLNISTSTMIAGIRGTAGYVEVLDRWTTGLTVLEGVVQCSVADPVTGQVKTEDVRGGETVWGVVYPQEQAGDKCDIVRREWTVEGTPGFVLWDVVRDMDLCDRIQADTGVDIPLELAKEAGGDPSGREPDRQTATPEVLDEIKQRLERDETDLQQRQEQVDTALREQDAGGSPDKVFVQNPASNNNSGSGSSSAPSESTVTLTMPVTDMDVQQALNRPATQRVVVVPGASSAPLDIGINMTVDSGKTLTLNSGVPAQVLGSLTVNGTADLGDDLTNNGTVTVNSANTLRVAGSLTNNHTMIVTATGRSITEGTFTNSAGAALDLTDGARVLAGHFALTAPVEGWSVSGTQSDGYYHLVQSATVGDFTVTGGKLDTDYSYAGGVLTVKTATPLTVSSNAETQDTIFVAKDINADITLAGVNINVGDIWGGTENKKTAFQVEKDSSGHVKVTLAGGTTNSLTSGTGHSGLEMDSSTGTLTIEGPGALTAQGSMGSGSGIGGSYEGAGACTIIINGGDITAIGATQSMNGGYQGFGGAGIGTAHGNATVTINGGNITAYGEKANVSGGSYGSVGIGTAYGKTASVTINGGTVNAFGQVGIGNYNTFEYGTSASITMTGGAVNATGKMVGIGCTDQYNGGRVVSSKVTISGDANVTAINEDANGSAIGASSTSSIAGTASVRGKPQKLITPVPDGWAVSGPDASGYYTLVSSTMPLTDDEVQALLNGADNITIKANADASKNTLTIDSGLTVAAGKTLTLEPGIDIEMQASRNIEIGGTMTANSIHDVSAMVTVNDGASLRLLGDLTGNAAVLRVAATGSAIIDGVLNLGATPRMLLQAKPGATVKAKTAYGSSWETYWSWSAAAADGYRTYTYTPPPFSVTFNAAGGTFSDGGNEKTVQTGDDGIVLAADWPTPARTGYAFVGWFTNSGSSGTERETDYAFVEDTTLYAHWSNFWSYDEATKTLTIFSNGTFESTPPWDSLKSDITTVTIKSGVTSIEDSAFLDCANLTSVTIPDSVTSIGMAAFRGCTSLTGVTIPDGVTSIGMSAFQDCSALASVTIPNSVTSIGYSAFRDCDNLTDVTIPSSVKTIGGSVFNSCDNLTRVEIQGGITNIGDYTFYYCEKLASVTIPNSVTTIGEGAFGMCSSLTNLTIPQNVTTIRNNAFESCLKLTNIEIPSGVTSIEQKVFSGCSALTSVTIPNGVTSVGKGAFSYCSALTNVTIPNSVTTIEESAFEFCTSLTDITVPSTVLSIGGETFANCTELQSAAMNCGITTLPTGIFRNCTSLKNVTFPSSLKIINTETFAECTGLTEIDLPEGLTTINGDSFQGCTSLAKVKLPSTVTTVARTAFNKDQNIEFTYAGDDTAWTSLMKDSEGTIGGSGWTVHCTDGDGTYTETGWTFNATP